MKTRRGGGHGLDRSGSGKGRDAGTCECGNEPLSSINFNAKNFLTS